MGEIEGPNKESLKTERRKRNETKEKEIPKRSTRRAYYMCSGRAKVPIKRDEPHGEQKGESQLILLDVRREKGRITNQSRKFESKERALCLGEIVSK